MMDLDVGEWREVTLRVPQETRLHLVADAAARESELLPVARLAHACLARTGSAAAGEEPWREWAACALSTVQQLARLVDPPELDVVAGPIAVLRRGGGDCLTLSGLLLAMLRAMGLHAVLARITRQCDTVDHVAVLVWLDGHFVWADAVSDLPLGQVTHGVPCPSPELVEIV